MTLHTRIVCHAAALCAAACVIFANIPEAVAQHRVEATAGVPVPIEVYGVEPSGEGVGLDRIVSLSLGYQWQPTRRQWWRVGAILSYNSVIASTQGDGVTGRVTLWSPTVLTAWTPEVRLSQSWSAAFEAALGATLVRNTIYVDEGLNKQTHALGGYAHLSVGAAWGEHLCVGVRLAISALGAPLDEKTWYNEPLGRTMIARPAAFVQWRF